MFTFVFRENLIRMMYIPDCHLDCHWRMVIGAVIQNSLRTVVLPKKLFRVVYI
jgi:hypothetical protein